MTYLDKLKSGDAKIESPFDATQFFKQLLKHEGDPVALVLLFDQKLESSLVRSVDILYPDTKQIFALLACLGVKQLDYGIYKSKRLDIYRAIYSSTFLSTISEKPALGDVDPLALAWFLLKISNNPDDADLGQAVRGNVQVQSLVQLLLSKREVKVIGQQLRNMYTDDVNSTAPGMPFRGGLRAARQEIKVIMRPPGERDHDNDCVNFRDVMIAPTALELQCADLPYLPQDDDGVGLSDTSETRLLGRQFRLLREDLIGPLREEMKEELKIPMHKRKKLFSNPCLIEVQLKPEPCVVAQVEMPQGLAKRLSKLSNKDQIEYMESGPGRNILARGTSTNPPESCTNTLSRIPFQDTSLKYIHFLFIF